MIPLPTNSDILPDADAVARAAAERLVALCGSAPNERIAVCLSGGSTPKRLYALLAGPDYGRTLPWARLHWFFGDDRMVAWDDAASNVQTQQWSPARNSIAPKTRAEVRQELVQAQRDGQVAYLNRTLYRGGM